MTSGGLFSLTYIQRLIHMVPHFIDEGNLHRNVFKIKFCMVFLRCRIYYLHTFRYLIYSSLYATVTLIPIRKFAFDNFPQALYNLAQFLSHKILLVGIYFESIFVSILNEFAFRVVWLIFITWIQFILDSSLVIMSNLSKYWCLKICRNVTVDILKTFFLNLSVRR